METPVVLLVFNRPETTRRVLTVVAEANPGTLLVVADGPRSNNPEDFEKCARVRELVDTFAWKGEILKDYSDTNLGCKQRVSSGLDWAFDICEEAIILEDDCLPHPDFFRFCEQLLEKYRHDDRMMMIAGTNYLLNIHDLPEAYLFSRYFAVWGWASWRRAWRKCDQLMSNWPLYKKQGQLGAFYRQKHVREHLSELFDGVYEGVIDTWDVQWFYSCLFNNGLSAVPRVNLVSNIGVEGTHTDGCDSKFNLPTYALPGRRLIHPKEVFPNQLYDDEFFRREFQVSQKQKLKRRLTHLKRILNR